MNDMIHNLTNVFKNVFKCHSNFFHISSIIFCQIASVIIFISPFLVPGY